MPSPLALTFDCGTQSLRALLFDKNGNIIDMVTEYYPPYIAQKFGYAEQEASVFVNALCRASLRLHSQCFDEWDRIRVVSLTAIRDTYVCVDRNIEPVRPVIMWHDQREAKCADPLPASSTMAFQLVGMSDFSVQQRKITKSNWIRENEPENWKNTYMYLPFSAYMTYILTGNPVDSVASQAGHVPFDFKSRKWMDTTNIKYPIFAIEPDKLPKLVEPCTMLGEITEKASKLTAIPEGTPVIAAGSDKGCETLGTGCISSDKANISFGTAASIQLVTSRYVEPQQFLPSYPSVVPNLYNPEVQVYRGYWMLNWFINEFARDERELAKSAGIPVEEYLNTWLNDTPPGAEGLILQPYWGAELRMPEARGAIIGFTDHHDRKHVYRAILEGINFDLMRGLKTMESRSGIRVKQITVSGGGARSETICQLAADMFGKPVRRVQTHEASGLGCAIAAFIGIGEFESFDKAIESMVHYKDVFVPDQAKHKKYEKIYNNIYKRIYPRLQLLYKEMRRL